MNSKQYVISELKRLTEKFPNIQCKYRYDEFCESYYVQILPSKFFKDSDDLAESRGDVLDNFLETYPDESLVFLTEGSLIKMDNSELTINGSTYFQRQSSGWKDFEKLISSLNIGCDNTDLIAGENNYALAA